MFPADPATSATGSRPRRLTAPGAKASLLIKPVSGSSIAEHDVELPTAFTETHISTVFFLGDRAYKLKKPVTTGFLDFSSPDLRRVACKREVELNRRLSPDVYLGVAQLSDVDGRPCDYLTVMKRLPPERGLAALVRAGRDVDDALRGIAHQLAAFHSRATRSAAICHQGKVRQVKARWAANLKEAQDFGETISAPIRREIQGLANDYLDGCAALFERRVEEGRIIDGHGDLLAEDIFCMEGSPRILDCLEFDDHLRYVDVLDDASFLAMDLERLGREDLGERFIDLYREMSGDNAPRSLVHHYMAYRALVRAKVAAIRAGQGEGAKLEEAVACLQLARSHLMDARPMLLLVGGGPGTGKSTLCHDLAEQRGWMFLSSDEVRKHMAGLSFTFRATSGFNRGIYSPEVTERTYRELLDRASRLLRMGESVVLDGTWSNASVRQSARLLAAETRSDIVEFRCDAPPALCEERIRTRADITASDATPEVARRLAQQADAWPEAEIVDTTEPAETSVTQILDSIAQRRAPVKVPCG
jgi:uncharacterized protein